MSELHSIYDEPRFALVVYIHKGDFKSIKDIRISGYSYFFLSDGTIRRHVSKIISDEVRNGFLVELMHEELLEVKNDGR